ncbi:MULTISPECIES: isoprenyl transferase [Eubacterium]|uniref:Isoprenyl transferase n=1 Tax=Eubacterium barkeri TaxID=1528 RepID=A0A1H3DYM3_EUBBA|nr:isoprenyl transferase [Eubacterium barkeri]SDX71506.1 Undecaprenyl pyrophosphate synthetase [Eubacterium barkeri]
MLADFKIDMGNIPAHVAIIMDGNGRWAKRKLRPRLFGHNAGMKALHTTVKTASDLGVKVLTVYAFSTENWKRSPEEVDGLMKIAVEYFIKEIAELHENHVQVRMIGDMSRVPADVQKAAADACGLTAENEGLILNVALNYGGRDEILRAVKAIMAEGIPPEEVTEACISNHLYTAGLPDPDIILRTGGEKRLSNFLLWQDSYAEIIFDDIWWPDFDSDAFYRVIEEYQKRERRYGAVK